jgi:Big-like domain-containing protein/WD40 repeat protein
MNSRMRKVLGLEHARYWCSAVAIDQGLPSIKAEAGFRKDDVTTQVAVRRRPLCWALSVAALALLAVNVGLQPAIAQSGSPSGPSPIYFGDAPLASVLPDGSGSTEYAELASVSTGAVVVSPDRTQVAWDQPGSGGLTDVDIADIDSAGLTTLWAGTSAGRPVWKSDGSALAFLGQLSGTGPGVFIQSVHGGDAQFIASSALAGQFEPTDWSADGSTLVGMYTANIGCDGVASEDQVTAIALLQLATNAVRPLTHDCHEGASLVRDLEPALSPDGTQLVFIRYGATQGLDRMGVDGTDRQELLTGNLCCAMPAWSPDGTQLAYYSDPGNNQGGIYVANADGSDPAFLARALHLPATIQWGIPDNTSGAPPSSTPPSGASPSTGSTAPSTNTALSATPATATAHTPVTLTATVHAVKGTRVPAGEVSFRDATAKRVVGTATLVNGSASIMIPNLATGDHEISVSYQSSDPTLFAGSSSPAVDVLLTPVGTAGSQHVTIGDDAGGLTITTPYGPGHPLNLGPLVLDSSGRSLTASGTFGCSSDHAAGIEVTDNRSGNANWSAYISSTDFTDRSSHIINAENLGLTAVTLVPVGSNSAAVPVTQTVQLNPAIALSARDPGSQGLRNGPHLLATTTHGGYGSVGICGILTLTAPTSTPPGIYTSNLTLTIG